MLHAAISLRARKVIPLRFPTFRWVISRSELPIRNFGIQTFSFLLWDIKQRTMLRQRPTCICNARNLCSCLATINWQVEGWKLVNILHPLICLNKQICVWLMLALSQIWNNLCSQEFMRRIELCHLIRPSNKHSHPSQRVTPHFTFRKDTRNSHSVTSLSFGKHSCLSHCSIAPKNYDGWFEYQASDLVRVSRWTR